MQHDQKASIGMLMRDETSQFFRAISDVYHHAMAAAVSEEWGFLQNLKCIESLDDHNVIFELNCKMVVDDVHTNVYRSEHGSNIQECKMFLHRKDSFSTTNK
jgi:hypothetical protein